MSVWADVALALWTLAVIGGWAAIVWLLFIREPRLGRREQPRLFEEPRTAPTQTSLELTQD